MKAAFSLLELLVVVAIIALLATIAIPSMASILGGSRLSYGTESVVGSVTTARQLAATKNRDIEVRLLSYADPARPDSTQAIRAIQILELAENGTNPIGKVRLLPSNIVISSDPELSSLAKLTERDSTPQDPQVSPVGRDYKVRAFRLKPDGSMNLARVLPASVTNFFLTLHDEKVEPLSANFATIRLEPSTGSLTVFRP